LPPMSRAIAERTSLYLAKKSPTEISMPTVMKKSPIRRPLYAAMSDSTCIANSVSASRRPAYATRIYLVSLVFDRFPC